MALTPNDLVEIHLIEQLKYRYARCLDLKLWDELRTLLVADAVCDYSGGKYHQEGADEIVAWIRKGTTEEASARRQLRLVRIGSARPLE